MLSRDDDKHEYDWAVEILVGRHAVEDIEMRWNLYNVWLKWPIRGRAEIIEAIKWIVFFDIIAVIEVNVCQSL